MNEVSESDADTMPVSLPPATHRQHAPKFLVVEGLSAVGKSTIAPLLAQRINAVYLDTLAPELRAARRHIDQQRLLQARLHFWMMVNYVASDTVRGILRSGQDVVIESYFYRTLATHAAMGIQRLPDVDWNLALKPDFIIELTLAEDIRQLRLAARVRTGHRSYWSELEERGINVSRQAYASFDLNQVNTTNLDPSQIVTAIMRSMTTVGIAHVG